MLGYPVLSIRSIPKDEAWLPRFFAEDLKKGRITTPLEIGDVWPENYSSNSAQKVWAAKFAAHHPNVVVLDLSSFKCGHDAPTYGIIDSIISAARHALLGAARHRRQQAGRLDQDPRQDLRPQPDAAQGAARGRRPEKQELLHRDRQEAAGAAARSRRKQLAERSQKDPAVERQIEEITEQRARLRAGPRRQDRRRAEPPSGAERDEGRRHRAARHQAPRRPKTHRPAPEPERPRDRHGRPHDSTKAPAFKLPILGDDVADAETSTSTPSCAGSRTKSAPSCGLAADTDHWVRPDGQPAVHQEPAREHHACWSPA